MAKHTYSPLSTFQYNWNLRRNWAVANSIPYPAFHAIQQLDVNRLKSGSYPMSNAEFVHAAAAAGMGHPFTPPPQSSPSNVIGNIGTDVKDIGLGLSGMVGGLLGDIAHPTRIARGISKLPGEYSKLSAAEDAARKAGGNWGALKALYSNVVKDMPVLNNIPAFSLATGAFSPTGRHDIAMHPLLSAINAGAAVAPVLGVAGKAADAAGAEGLANALKGTATGASRLGDPYGLPVRVLSKVPIGGGRTIGSATRAAYESSSIAPRVVSLSRIHAQLTRKAQADLGAKAAVAQDIFKSFSPVEQAQLNDIVTHYYPTLHDDLPEKWAQAINYVKQQSDSLATAGVSSGALKEISTPVGPQIYHPSSRVAVLSKQHDQSKTFLDAAHSRVAAANTALSRAREATAALHIHFPTFGETAEEATIRPPTPPTPQSLAESVKPLSTIARAMHGANGVDDRKVEELIRPTGRVAQQLTAARPVFATLPKLEESLRSGDHVAAGKQFTTISRALRKPSIANNPSLSPIRDYINTLQDHFGPGLRRLQSTGRPYQRLLTQESSAQRRLNTQQSRLALRQAKHTKLTQKLEAAIKVNAPAAYQPLARSILTGDITHPGVQSARDWVKNQTFAGNMDDATAQHIFSAFDRDWLGAYNKYIPQAERIKLEKSVQSTWQDLHQLGYRPIYVPKISAREAAAARHPGFFPLRESSVAAANPRVLLATEGVKNLPIALQKGAADVVMQKASQDLINHIISSKGSRTGASLYDEFSAIEGKARANPQVPLEQAIADRINKSYIRWDPNNRLFPFQNAHLSGPMFSNDSHYIPKNLYNAADRMFGTKALDHTIVGKVYHGGTTVFRTSLLSLSPRFASHVILGGMTMLLGRHPSAPLYAAKAWNIVHNHTMPESISRHLDQWSSDQVWHLGSGSKMGDLLVAHHHDRAAQLYNTTSGRLRHAAQLQRNFYETFTNMYRTMAYLSGQHKALSRGMTEQAARTYGIKLANKTLADIDSMTPIERATLQRIFPFYGFTKHILRYALTMPVDHPIRTAILANIANQQIQDYPSGIPQKYMMLFDLGSPDAMGNIHTLDTRSINTFRNLGNYFTLAGWLSATNPAIQSVANLFGMDTLTGMQSLYPQLTYSTLTGTTTSALPLSNDLFKAVENYIPQAGALDAFYGMTQNARQLKAADPSGYRAMVFEQLGLPFAPNTYNVYNLQARSEIARYRVAEQDVNTFLQTGDPKKLEKYGPNALLPYAGYNIPASYLIQLYRMFQPISTSSGIPANQLITPPKPPRL